MAYARKTGFGGDNGNLVKGARVMRVNSNQGIFWTTSWVDDFYGNVYNQNTPSEVCTRYVDPTLNPNATAPVQPWID